MQVPTTIEQVLSCKALPSLPAVAVEVLALTRDPNVPLEKIARVIQNDPALTAKVLKTVNSSYYGLSQKCATLNRAIGYLGIKTVKSLVLGFCLVDSTRSVEEGGFDLAAYWKRGIYSATAARMLAGITGATDADEAFTACLFQDIGMLACFAAMGNEYDAVLRAAPLSHDALAAFERSELGFDHCELGSKFAEKWNLPQQHIETIAHHHNPDKAPEAFRELARIVSLSNLVAEVAEAELPGQAAVQVIIKANEWFGEGCGDIEGLLDRVGDAARQLAKEFGKDLGGKYDAASIMAEANELLMETSIQGEREAITLKKSADEMAQAALTDALTGAFNRKHFDASIKKLFDEAVTGGTPLGVLFIDGDRFKSVNDTHGHAAGDAVLRELARRFKASAPEGALVCRYGGEEFAVILPGHDVDAAANAGERVRAEIAGTPFSMAGTGAKVDSLAVTVSIGVSAYVPGDGAMTAVALVHEADQAVYAAKKNGRNRVERAGVPVEAVTPAEMATVASAPSLLAGLSHATRGVGTAAPSVTPMPVPSAEVTGIAASTVPTAPPASKAPMPVTPVAPSNGRTSTGSNLPIDVLLVEDDPLAGRLLITLLGRRANTTIRHVRSGEEAIPLLNGKTLPNLVITDLNLRSMNGVQLIACARANPRTKTLPMVVLSASDDPQDEAECMRAGATFYMNKELIVTDLNRTVAKIMSAAA
jgi:diguanylate cyclase (GGDEF)-like protein